MNGLLYTGTRGVRGVELLKIRPYHFSEYSKHDTTVRFASVVDVVIAFVQSSSFRWRLS